MNNLLLYLLPLANSSHTCEASLGDIKIVFFQSLSHLFLYRDVSTLRRDYVFVLRANWQNSDENLNRLTLLITTCG